MPKVPLSAENRIAPQRQRRRESRRRQRFPATRLEREATSLLSTLSHGPEKAMPLREMFGGSSPFPDRLDYTRFDGFRDDKRIFVPLVIPPTLRCVIICRPFVIGLRLGRAAR